MFPRRLLPLLARFVLAWFALHLGAGVAAPLVRAVDPLQLVCAGGSLKLQPGSEEPGTAAAAGMACPLCSPLLAPPPAAPAAVLPAARHAAPLRAVRSAAPRAALAPPLARGPPAAIRS